MLRKNFLKSMAFAALASNFLKHIPLPVEPEPELKVLLASPTKEAAKIHYQHVQYALGFKVSQEMIEDDAYSRQVQEKMMDAWRHEMLTRFNTDLDFHSAY